MNEEYQVSLLGNGSNLITNVSYFMNYNSLMFGYFQIHVTFVYFNRLIYKDLYVPFATGINPYNFGEIGQNLLNRDYDCGLLLDYADAFLNGNLIVHSSVYDMYYNDITNSYFDFLRSIEINSNGFGTYINNEMSSPFATMIDPYYRDNSYLQRREQMQNNQYMPMLPVPNPSLIQNNFNQDPNAIYYNQTLQNNNWDNSFQNSYFGYNTYQQGFINPQQPAYFFNPNYMNNQLSQVQALGQNKLLNPYNLYNKQNSKTLAVIVGILLLIIVAMAIVFPIVFLKK